MSVFIIVMLSIVIGLLVTGIIGFFLISFAYCFWHECTFKELWDFTNIKE